MNGGSEGHFNIVRGLHDFKQETKVIRLFFVEIGGVEGKSPIKTQKISAAGKVFAWSAYISSSSFVADDTSIFLYPRHRES